MKKIGIIGAMEVEISLLKSMMKNSTFDNTASVTISGGLTYFEGTIKDVPVVIVKSGVGKVNAALCAQYLIMHFHVTNIINTGIAGAIANNLDILDFVISTDAVYHDMDATGFGYKPTEIPQMQTSSFIADKDMIKVVEDSFKTIPEANGHHLILGRISTGDQFIASKDKKNNIQKICNPACVEMEGAAIAHTAFLNNIPFIIIRCMSDKADDNHESVYTFNEAKAAELSAKLLLAVIEKI